MNLRVGVAWCVVASTAVWGGAACSESTAGGAATEGAPGPRLEAIIHEPCNPAGHKLQSYDTRGDSKSVVTKVLDDSGRELCRITDINHDGKADLYEYFDGSGAVRRRESDYDANGTIDAVELFEDGRLVKREYDTTGQRRVDTWDYFDKGSGKRIRRERDTTNDGKVDQWWTWEGDKITIAIDRNGDGKPDPGAVLVLDAKTGDVAKETKETKPPPPQPAADAPPPPTAPSVATAPALPAAPAPKLTATNPKPGAKK